ncbi:pleiotropic drug resistance ABC transporter [Cyathus striatus]|nr:pleiotropic drug resistance ABC transporter [Cyathus striatus]
MNHNKDIDLSSEPDGAPVLYEEPEEEHYEEPDETHHEEPDEGAHEETQESRVQQCPRPRRMSTEYFDPSGVQEFSNALRQVLDDMSIREVASPSISRTETRNSDVIMRELLSPQEMLEIGLQDLGLTFEDLRVVGSGTSVAVQPTVASSLNPFNWLRSLLSLRHPPVHDIISGFEGCVRPGEMLLVLGRPGAGNSTLLRVLANQRRGYHKIEGSVNYDWISPSEIDKRYRGDVQYYPAEDLHFPSATVERAILFAAKTRVAQGRIAGFEGNDYARLMTEACITVMGLKNVKNTPIGNLTYAEKKRVSVCETLVTRSRIACWDSEVEGTDETTFTLYRCGEAIYDLFDKVCLVYEGRMIYYGATDLAKQYFIDMGYQPSHRQTTIEFLLSLTDARHRRNLVQTRTVPTRPSEFASYYHQSQTREDNKNVAASYLQSTMSLAGESPRFPRVRRKSAYILSFLAQLKLVIRQRLQIIKFDLVYHMFYVLGSIFEAIMLGHRSLASVTIPYNTFLGQAFSFSIAAGDVPPGIAALAMTIVDVPYNLIKTLPFTIIVYYFTSLGHDAGQYMTFYIINVFNSLGMRAYVRTLAALLGNDVIAQGVGGTVFLAFTLYIGFEIPKRGMVDELKWIMYINPMSYAFEAMMGNEFKYLDGPCPHPAPSGPGYENVSAANQVCTLVGGWPGDLYVEGRNYVYEYFGFNVDDVWKDFGILCAAYGGFTIAFLLVTEFSASTPDKGRVVFLQHAPSPNFSRAIIPDPEKRGEEKDADEVDMVSDLSGWSNPEIEEAMKNLHKMMHSFCWHDLVYTVQMPDSKLRVLDGVTGLLRPGNMMVILGEPGSGKRTLVKALAEKVDEGWISGERYLDWRRLPPDYRTQIGFCHSTDIHVPTLTTFSAVKHSALMRQPPDITYEETISYAHTCIRACGLEALKDAMIGSLKPEQSRRVTICVELAASPRLLFLDSPTNGLDPQSALAIMVMLRNLANHGQTILCSLHQPSAAVFELFDEILVLQKPGRAAYFGDMGLHASTVTKYFETKSSKRCDPSGNPAVFIVDALTNTILDKDWHRIWLESEEFSTVRTNMNKNIHQEYSQKPLPARRTAHYVRPWWYQAWVLYKRGTIYFWRNPAYVLSKLFLNIFGGLFVGFSYFKTDNSLLGARNKLFSIFAGLFLSIPLGFILLFPYFEIRAVYESRERANVSYYRSAFTASHLLAELQWNVLGAFLYFFTWYWTAGFPTQHAAYSYLIYGVLLPAYITSLAIAIGSMSPNASVATFLYSSTISIIVTFDDTVQPFSEMGWFLWLYYITPFTYIMDSIYGYSQHGLTLECSVDELTVIDVPSGLTCISYLEAYIDREGGYVLNPNSTTYCVYCPVSSVDSWMRECYNISYSHRWRDVGILLGYISFHVGTNFIFIAYLE